MAEEERDDLPLVNALRDDVRRWRASEWQGATVTTKALLRHWSRDDRQRRLFFCQLEAVETVVYLREMLGQGRTPRFMPQLSLADHAALLQGHNPRPLDWRARVAQHPKLADIPHEARLAPPLRYACKMATGSGKTVVMAMLIAWAFCNRGRQPSDARYPRRALVVCPNLTIKERLSVLRPEDMGNYYDQFDIVPAGRHGALRRSAPSAARRPTGRPVGRAQRPRVFQRPAGPRQPRARTSTPRARRRPKSCAASCPPWAGPARRVATSAAWSA